VTLDPRRRLLLDSAPESFIFEEYFKKNGTHIIRSKISLETAGLDPSNMMKCSPVLNKDQEFILFRKYNYFRYRIISSIAGSSWPRLIGKKDELKKKVLRMSPEKLSLTENFVRLAEEVRNTILKSNMRLVVRPVSRYADQDSQKYEEIISNAYMHVIKAINGFDYKRGLKFSTYCVNAIKNNLFRDFTMESSRRARTWGELSEENEAVFIPIKDTRAYDSDFISRGLKTLGKEERFVIGTYFGIQTEKKQLKEIALQLGVSNYVVSRIRDEALKTMSRMTYDPI